MRLNLKNLMQKYIYDPKKDGKKCFNNENRNAKYIAPSESWS